MNNIKKYFVYIFKILYGYYDSEWEDAFFSASFTISMLVSTFIYEILTIFYYYTQAKLLKEIEIIFILAILSIFIFYYKKKQLDELIKTNLIISKKDKYISYFIIILFLIFWFCSIFLFIYIRDKLAI